MDSKDALDLSDSVSDFQFLAVSGLNWKNQIAWITVTPGCCLFGLFLIDKNGNTSMYNCNTTPMWHCNYNISSLLCQHTVTLENRNGDREESLESPGKWFFKRLIKLYLFPEKKKKERERKVGLFLWFLKFQCTKIAPSAGENETLKNTVGSAKNQFNSLSFKI